MLVIDILLLLGGIAIIGGAATVAAVKVGKRLDRVLAERRARALGRRNAEKEELVLAHACMSCGRQVDPEIDIWSHGSWWHKKCWERVLGDEDDAG
jgi:hypothetical protein